MHSNGCLPTNRLPAEEGRILAYFVHNVLRVHPNYIGGAIPQQAVGLHIPKWIPQQSGGETSLKR